MCLCYFLGSEGPDYTIYIIIACSVVGFLLLVIVILLCCICCKKSKKKKKETRKLPKKLKRRSAPRPEVVSSENSSLHEDSGDDNQQNLHSPPPSYTTIVKEEENQGSSNERTKSQKREVNKTEVVVAKEDVNNNRKKQKSEHKVKQIDKEEGLETAVVKTDVKEKTEETNKSKITRSNKIEENNTIVVNKGKENDELRHGTAIYENKLNNLDSPKRETKTPDTNKGKTETVFRNERGENKNEKDDKEKRTIKSSGTANEPQVQQTKALENQKYKNGKASAKLSKHRDYDKSSSHTSSSGEQKKYENVMKGNSNNIIELNRSLNLSGTLPYCENSNILDHTENDDDFNDETESSKYKDKNVNKTTLSDHHEPAVNIKESESSVNNTTKNASAYIINDDDSTNTVNTDEKDKVEVTAITNKTEAQLIYSEIKNTQQQINSNSPFVSTQASRKEQLCNNENSKTDSRNENKNKNDNFEKEMTALYTDNSRIYIPNAKMKFKKQSLTRKIKVEPLSPLVKSNEMKLIEIKDSSKIEPLCSGKSDQNDFENKTENLSLHPEKMIKERRHHSSPGSIENKKEVKPARKSTIDDEISSRYNEWESDIMSLNNSSSAYRSRKRQSIYTLPLKQYVPEQRYNAHKQPQYDETVYNDRLKALKSIYHNKSNHGNNDKNLSRSRTQISMETLSRPPTRKENPWLTQPQNTIHDGRGDRQITKATIIRRMRTLGVQELEDDDDIPDKISKSTAFDILRTRTTLNDQDLTKTYSTSLPPLRGVPKQQLPDLPYAWRP